MAAGDGAQPFSFPTLAQEKHAGKGWEKLSDLSDKDKPWDRHRGNAQDVAGTYATAWEGWLRRYGERVEACSPWLGFQQGANPETGELALTLKRAYLAEDKIPALSFTASACTAALFFSWQIISTGIITVFTVAMIHGYKNE